MGSTESKSSEFRQFLKFYTFKERVSDNRFGEIDLYFKNDSPETLIFIKTYNLTTDEEKNRFQELLVQRNYSNHTHLFSPVYSESRHLLTPL